MLDICEARDTTQTSEPRHARARCHIKRHVVLTHDGLRMVSPKKEGGAWSGQAAIRTLLPWLSRAVLAAMLKLPQVQMRQAVAHARTAPTSPGIAW